MAVVQQHVAVPAAAPLAVAVQAPVVALQNQAARQEVAPAAGMAVGPQAAPVVVPVAVQAPTAGPVSAQQLETAINNAVQKKAKKCFRCGDVAHRMAECTAVICDYCEGPEHVNGPCPLLSGPKPRIDGYELMNPKRKVMM